jgi:hypothetical protein
MTLLFWSCHFDATVDFSGADFLSLRLVDCTLPAFIGISLSTKADLTPPIWPMWVIVPCT